MSKAVITLVEDGAKGLHMNVVFEGGFNLESGAHQVANMMLKHADENLQRVEEPVTEVADSLIIVDHLNA